MATASGSGSSRQPPSTIRRTWRRGKKLGAGSFGEIFHGKHITTGEEVGIKLEPVNCKHPQLMFEAKIYHILRGGDGIPDAYWYGVEGSFNVLVMELLGPSLEDVFTIYRRQLSVRFVLQLTEQMLNRIDYVHFHHFLHRDVKPDNFLTGKSSSGKQQCIYVIDFGLAKKFKDSNGKHIPFREGKSLTGTARYASINTHIGYEQSRRDDLEGMMYVAIYLLRGSLPWQGLFAAGKEEKYRRIMQTKMDTKPEVLCADMPAEFLEILLYVRKLQFDERPKYAHIRELIQRAQGKLSTSEPQAALPDWDAMAPAIERSRNRQMQRDPNIAVPPKPDADVKQPAANRENVRPSGAPRVADSRPTAAAGGQGNLRGGVEASGAARHPPTQHVGTGCAPQVGGAPVTPAVPSPTPPPATGRGGGQVANSPPDAKHQASAQLNLSTQALMASKAVLLDSPHATLTTPVDTAISPKPPAAAASQQLHGPRAASLNAAQPSGPPATQTAPRTTTATNSGTARVPPVAAAAVPWTPPVPSKATDQKPLHTGLGSGPQTTTNGFPRQGPSASQRPADPDAPTAPSAEHRAPLPKPSANPLKPVRPIQRSHEASLPSPAAKSAAPGMSAVVVPLPRSDVVKIGGALGLATPPYASADTKRPIHSGPVGEGIPPMPRTTHLSSGADGAILSADRAWPESLPRKGMAKQQDLPQTADSPAVATGQLRRDWTTGDFRVSGGSGGKGVPPSSVRHTSLARATRRNDSVTETLPSARLPPDLGNSATTRQGGAETLLGTTQSSAAPSRARTGGRSASKAPAVRRGSTVENPVSSPQKQGRAQWRKEVADRHTSGLAEGVATDSSGAVAAANFVLPSGPSAPRSSPVMSFNDDTRERQSGRNRPVPPAAVPGSRRKSSPKFSPTNLIPAEGNGRYPETVSFLKRYAPGTSPMRSKIEQAVEAGTPGGATAGGLSAGRATHLTNRSAEQGDTQRSAQKPSLAGGANNPSKTNRRPPGGPLQSSRAAIVADAHPANLPVAPSSDAHVPSSDTRRRHMAATGNDLPATGGGTSRGRGSGNGQAEPRSSSRVSRSAGEITRQTPPVHGSFSPGFQPSTSQDSLNVGRAAVRTAVVHHTTKDAPSPDHSAPHNFSNQQHAQDSAEQRRDTDRESAAQDRFRPQRPAGQSHHALPLRGISPVYHPSDTRVRDGGGDRQDPGSPPTGEHDENSGRQDRGRRGERWVAAGSNSKSGAAQVWLPNSGGRKDRQLEKRRGASRDPRGRSPSPRESEPSSRKLSLVGHEEPLQQYRPLSKGNKRGEGVAPTAVPRRASGSRQPPPAGGVPRLSLRLSRGNGPHASPEEDVPQFTAATAGGAAKSGPKTTPVSGSGRGMVSHTERASTKAVYRNLAGAEQPPGDSTLRSWVLCKPNAPRVASQKLAASVGTMQSPIAPTSARTPTRLNASQGYGGVDGSAPNGGGAEVGAAGPTHSQRDFHGGYRPATYVLHHLSRTQPRVNRLTQSGGGGKVAGRTATTPSTAEVHHQRVVHQQVLQAKKVDKGGWRHARRGHEDDEPLRSNEDDRGGPRKRERSPRGGESDWVSSSEPMDEVENRAQVYNRGFSGDSEGRRGTLGKGGRNGQFVSDGIVSPGNPRGQKGSYGETSGD